jgi:hypothetical protein
VIPPRQHVRGSAGFTQERASAPKLARYRRRHPRSVGRASAAAAILQERAGKPEKCANLIPPPNGAGAARVDIHIPDKTRRGMAKLMLKVNGATGPAVETPVR